MLNIGNKEVKEIYLGNKKVSEVYLGEKKIRPVGAKNREVNSNTIAYYPFKRDTNDYSGKGNHITNRDFTINSAFGGVASFNGNQSGILPSITGYKTISFWARFTQFNSILFSGENDLQYCFQVQEDKTSQSNQKGDNYDAPLGRNIGTYEWHHFLLSQDNGVIELYLDGVKYDTRRCPEISRPITRIGYFKYHNRYYFSGWLSELIFESKARTPEEVQAYYNQAKGQLGS
ncbi:MAG: hypothetical protein HG424_003065 [candidate division SR1 bacterium]|nr:hypothetical protein [candidate division SR1 bacterium]